MISNRLGAALLATLLGCMECPVSAQQPARGKSGAAAERDGVQIAQSISVLQRQLAGFGLNWASRKLPRRNVIIAAAPLMDSLIILEMAASGSTAEQIRGLLMASPDARLIEQRNSALLTGAPLVPSIGVNLVANGPYGLRLQEQPPKGSPAGVAGLRKGDLIFSVDGFPARNLEEFDELLGDSIETVQLGMFSVEEGLADEDREVRVSAVHSPTALPELWPARAKAAVWLTNGLQPTPEFQQLVRQLRGVVIAESGGDSEKEIEKSLQAALPDFPGIRMPAIPRQPAFVIFNTLRIRLQWETPFDPMETRKGPFLGGPEPLIVDLMTSLSSHRYRETSDLRILDLDAKNSALFCRIVLPRDDSMQISNPGAAVMKASAIRPTDMQQSLVDLKLPRFHFSSRFSLRDLLQSGGVGDAWTDRAKFTRLDPRNQILLNDVVQDAEIHVDESGMRLDASVSAVGTSKGEDPQPEIHFHADRPFVFIIQNSAGFVFTAGLVEQPED
jgi:hypothetical protein